MAAFLLGIVLYQASTARPIPLEILSAQRSQYETTLQASPGDAAAQQDEVRVSEQIALTERASGNVNEALSDLLRAVGFVSNNSRLLYDVGVLEEQIGLYHDAENTVSQLRTLTPSNSQVTYLAARVELDLGELDAAERDMRISLAADPMDATAHYGMGRILQQGQRGNEAKVEFEKAIELQPTQTESYYQLGQIALVSGDYQEVIRQDSKVIGRDPNHGGALTSIGIAYFRMKLDQQAESFLARAVAAAPEYQLGHYFYGLVLLRLGKKDQSAKELAIATRLADETNRKQAQRLELNPQ